MPVAILVHLVSVCHLIVNPYSPNINVCLFAKIVGLLGFVFECEFLAVSNWCVFAPDFFKQGPRLEHAAVHHHSILFRWRAWHYRYLIQLDTTWYNLIQLDTTCDHLRSLAITCDHLRSLGHDTPSCAATPRFRSSTCSSFSASPHQSSWCKWQTADGLWKGCLCASSSTHLCFLKLFRTWHFVLYPVWMLVLSCVLVCQYVFLILGCTIITTNPLQLLSRRKTFHM